MIFEIGSEDEIADADLEDHIVQWPALLPKRARLKKRPKAEFRSGRSIAGLRRLPPRDAPMRAGVCREGEFAL